MTSRRNKNTKFHISPGTILAAVLILGVLLVGGISARYRKTMKTDESQVTAKPFYFTVDLLGDSRMYNDNAKLGDGTEYKFPDAQSGTWYLYGGTAHTITIHVRNYSDELRVTEDEITYSAAVKIQETNDSGDATESTLVGATLQKDNASFTGGTISKGTAGTTGSEDVLTLSIPEYGDAFKYPEGKTTVNVTLKSSAPYEKEIDLNFVLFSAETAVWYEVKDSVGSTYAELLIMTNMVSGSTAATDVLPVLSWDNNLSIDNANELTYKYTAGTDGTAQFNQQNINTSGGLPTMQLSRSLKPGESVSIYFFKADTSENYSSSRKPVSASETDGTYAITVQKQTVQDQ